jgi:beta-glucanase (GH16 family)
MSSYQALTQSSQLTFDDEFNSFVSSPNGSAGWMTAYPYVGPNARELTGDYQNEYLSDSSVGTNPFSVQNGVLTITASKAAAGSNPYGLPYTSGIITSYKSLSQTYGYFEISAQLPTGAGLWPSFYMLPTAANYTSELDVFETLGSTPNTIESTIHWESNGVWHATTDTITVANTQTGFHTYGVDWEPTTTTFYMDGQVIAAIPTPSQMDVPMYMIAVLQVGDTNTAYPGHPTSSSEFPASMQINYVRAYATANTIQVGGTAAIKTAAITGKVQVKGANQQGVVISLLNAAGTVIATQTTDANGKFSFTSLAAGNYQVRYTPPAGDSLASGGPAVTTSGLTAVETLTDGQSLTLASQTILTSDPGPSGGGGTITVGHGQTVNLTGKLLALITPGVTGDTETITAIKATAGTVTLGTGGAVTYQAPASGTATLTYTVTDQNGDSAAFNTGIVIDPGPKTAAGSGTVTVGGTLSLGASIAALITPGVAGDTETVTAVKTNGGSVTLGANGAISFKAPATAGTETVTYTVIDQYGDTATGAYTVTVLPGAANLQSHTAILGPSYPAWGGGFGGVTVSLINSAGVVVATTVSTASSGWYDFVNITPGTYQLGFSDPSGVVFQPGGPVNVSTGLTAPFTLTAGQSYIPANANYVAAASITGTVTAGGAGQAGVTVTLLTTSGSVVSTTTTASDGSFTFGQLEAGSYEVKYTAPSGKVLQSGPANTGTGLTSAITLTAGQAHALAAEVLTTSAVVVSNPATAQSEVLHLNGPTDPAMGSGESGVTVSLLNTSGTVIATTTTNSSGDFSFDQLAAGTYQLKYTPPAGQTFIPGAPENASTGLTAQFTVTAGQTLWAPAAWLISTLTFNGTGTTLVAPAGGFDVTGNATNGKLTLGNGNQYVTLTGTGGNTITAGTGSDTIVLSGTGNTVTVGAGSSYINAGSGKDTVHAAGGGVTIAAYGAGNTLDGGGLSFITTDGSANDKFVLNAANQGLTTITGFNTAANNILDLQRTLAGTNIKSDLSNIASFITAANTGANTTLYVNPTGAGATAFAVLNGVHVTVAQLQAAHEFSLT